MPIPSEMATVPMQPNGLPTTDGEPARSVAQLRMLHSLAAQLNGLGDVDQIGEAIARELRTLIDYHNCRVFVLREDGETLAPIAFRGELFEYQVETFDALVTKVGRGITGHVAETGESYLTPDAAADPYAILIPGTPDIEESMLAVPLNYAGRPLGVIVLSKLGIGQFDGEDMRLLEVLASHAAVAIENARLLQLERDSALRARESEARKSAILEAALDCVVAMDHRGRIVEFNPAAERTFGYARADVIGRELAAVVIPPGLRTRHRAGLARYQSTGETTVLGRRIEITAMRSDGTEFPAEVAITRVDVSGPPIFTGYIRDITDRKRAAAETERALEAEREAGERLRALDDLKNTFLQAVSHDLRTPLAAILGLALTLDRDDLELASVDARDLIGRLAANARKLDRILCNLLDLDRLMRGAIEPNRTRTDVGELIRRMVEESDFLLDRPVEVDADEVVGEIDAAKVERIVENLLVNAAKHTPSGTSIWVRATRDDDAVQILVEDSGPGVPQELREAIFEPFRRGNGDHHAPGVGIGLALVQRFAQIHGGTATVTERQGGGASFLVTLPERPRTREPAAP
jgi:PAS domain S-box-containing protein